MKPKAAIPQCELFGAQLSELLNPEHPLYVLAERIDWSQFDAAIDACYAADIGRPGVNTRLMVGLVYLKHAFDESDESLVARWVENPYWQLFCGCQYMQHELPIDPSSLSKWRKRVGVERLEKLLEATIKTALAMKALRPQEFHKVNVDTTVQEKAIAFPTDARLYHKMRMALVRRAQSLGIKLRQNYRFKSKRLLAKQGRYAHAQQLKRAAKATRQLKTFLGRVLRDVRRKATFLQGRIADERLRNLVALAERLLEQTRSSKHKLYSIHAPEVECIAKGKVHKRYEFGCKTSVATTSKNNWIVGAHALHGNPYDGHTLGGAIRQVERLTGHAPHDVMVDQGYRGHGYTGSASVHVVRSIPKRATRALRRMLKRRAAIEPTIGHLKSDNRLDRNYLTGREGDKINAVLSAAGYNLRKLLRWIVFAPIFWLMRWLKAMLAVEIRLHRAPRQAARPEFAPAMIRKSRGLMSLDHLSGTTHYDWKTKADLASARRTIVKFRAMALKLPFDEVSEIYEQDPPDGKSAFVPYDHTFHQGGLYLSRRRGDGDQETVQVRALHALFFHVHVQGAESASIGLASHPPVVLHREDVIERNKDGSERGRMLGQGDPIEFPTRRRGYYSWHSFCKTQYAGNPKLGGEANFLKAHLSLIELLDQIQVAGLKVRIRDDSRYAKHRDVDRLLRSLRNWDAIVARVAGGLSDALGDKSGTLIAPIKDRPDFEHLEAKGISVLRKIAARQRKRKKDSQ